NPSSPAICGSSSVVEHHLAKVGVAGSNPVFRSILYFTWRHSQGARPRSAKPLSPVQIRSPPPFTTCQCGGIGRRAGLKIPFPHGSVGSTPTTGTRMYRGRRLDDLLSLERRLF